MTRSVLTDHLIPPLYRLQSVSPPLSKRKLNSEERTAKERGSDRHQDEQLSNLFPQGIVNIWRPSYIYIWEIEQDMSHITYSLGKAGSLKRPGPTPFNRETNDNIAANNKIIIHSGTYTPSLHPLAPPRLNSISHLHRLRRNVIIMTLPPSPFVGCG